MSIYSPHIMLVTMASTRELGHISPDAGRTAGGWQWPVFLLVTYDTHGTGSASQTANDTRNLEQSSCQRRCWYSGASGSAPLPHPSRGHGGIRGGLMSWAGCLPWKQLWWHQGPPLAPSSEPKDPNMPAGRVGRGQKGSGAGTPAGKGWKVTICPPGVCRSQAPG